MASMSFQLASRASLLALAAMLSTACANQGVGTRVNAKIMSLKTGAIDAKGVQPVPGAQVAVTCPNGSPREIGRTGSDGHLDIDVGPDKSVPLDCDLAISQQGYRTMKVAVTEVCRLQGHGMCRALDVQAVLQPEAAPASPGASPGGSQGASQ
jgi:hypothetical protein